MVRRREGEREQSRRGSPVETGRIKVLKGSQGIERNS
jgi:hypothetical protein